MFKVVAGMALAVLWPAAGGAGAHPSSGMINGTVSDHTGARAPGVVVSLTDASLTASRVTTTDTRGVFTFASVASGRYALTFALPGFRTATRHDVRMEPAATETVDVTLELAGISERVEVTRGALDASPANVGTKIDARTLQEIPTGRDPLGALQTLAPQVVFSSEDVGGSQAGQLRVFSSNGSTWRQNTFAFNGVEVNDPASTGAASYDFDSFEQIRVSTAQHPAEVGPPGAYVNLVAKRGSDAFRGGASYFFQNERLRADNLTQAQRDRDMTVGSGIGLYSDANLHVGGPIVKDRLRFFASLRDWRIHRDVEGFPKTDDTDVRSALGDVSCELGRDSRIDLLATVQTYYQPRVGAGALISPEATGILDDVLRIVQGGYSRRVGGRALVDLRWSWADVDAPERFQPDATQQSTTEATTGLRSGAASSIISRFRSRLVGVATLSAYVPRWAGASHDLKIGGQLGRQASDSLVDTRDGIQLTTTNGEPLFVFAVNTPIDTRSRFSDAIGFLQDDVSAGRLTLNLGLRLQHTTGYLPAHATAAGPFVPALSFPRQDVISWTTLAPRLGVSYALRSDRTASIRLGYARYHHQLNPEPIEAVQNGYAFSLHGWNDRNGDRQFQPGELGTERFAFSGRSISTMDPKVRRPRTDELHAGFELQLPGGTRLSLDGVFRHARDLLATSEVGIPQDGSSYTPVTGLDPGPDGIPETADDRPVSLLNLKPELAGRQRHLVTNRSDFSADFKGVVVVLQRRFADRWQALLSYALSKDNLSREWASYGAFFGGEEESAGQRGFLDPNMALNNTRGPSFFDRTHNLRLTASYRLPKLDIALAGVFRLQTGMPYARFVSLYNDRDEYAFNQGAVSFFAEPRDAHRLPTLRDLDFRLSKAFDVRGRQRIEAIVDVFNVFNTNVVTGLNGNRAPVFETPDDILGPRAVRLGARWSF